MSVADMRTLQEVGGWRTLGMVERYSHPVESRMALAGENLASNSQHLSQQSENGLLATSA